ncbi:hypothetical protein LCGC14_2079770, partial [marine sediment metagenome]
MKSLPARLWPGLSMKKNLLLGWRGVNDYDNDNIGRNRIG